MTVIPVDSPAVAQGVGLFETMLVTAGGAVLRDAHYARMVNSCRALGFPPPDALVFQRVVDDAAAMFRGSEAALRCVYVPTRPDLGDPTAWILDATVSAVSPVTLGRRDSGRAITLDPSFRRALPEHKLTSYAACVIALRRAVDAGAHEALFVTPDGGVLEGTSTNVFAVDGDTLVTAPRTAGVLPGIMRAWVLEAAPRSGMTIEERVPDPDEIRAGSFLTSSLTLFAPIRQLDGAPCRSTDEVVERLAALWRREVLDA